jgi:hypothetical protein
VYIEMMGIGKGQAPQSRLVWIFDFKGLGKGSRNSTYYLDGNASSKTLWRL